MKSYKVLVVVTALNVTLVNDDGRAVAQEEDHQALTTFGPVSVVCAR